MISKKMANAINTQINREFYSAFLYLAMANDALDKGYAGTFVWMTLQFEEEQVHGLRLSKYLQDQGVRVKIEAMDKPKATWKDLLDIFKAALAHEKKVTAWFNQLYTLASAENDYATQGMLRWFIDEQVEEEANCHEAINALQMNATSKTATYMIDKQLGQRTASAPSSEEA